MIVVDTGPLWPSALANDNRHHECVELFTRAHLAGRTLLVPSPVVSEVCYMLEREAGSRLEADFLRSVGDGDFVLVELTSADLHRMAELVDTYADLPLGGVDASVIAVAERMGAAEVAWIGVISMSFVQHMGRSPCFPNAKGDRMCAS